MKRSYFTYFLPTVLLDLLCVPLISPQYVGGFLPDGLVKAIVSDVQDPIPFAPSIAKIGATVWTVSKSSLI